MTASTNICFQSKKEQLLMIFGFLCWANTYIGVLVVFVEKITLNLCWIGHNTVSLSNSTNESSREWIMLLRQFLECYSWLSLVMEFLIFLHILQLFSYWETLSIEAKRPWKETKNTISGFFFGRPKKKTQGKKTQALKKLKQIFQKNSRNFPKTLKSANSLLT